MGQAGASLFLAYHIRKEYEHKKETALLLTSMSRTQTNGSNWDGRGYNQDGKKEILA